MTRLADIEGIGAVYAVKLEEAGVQSIEKLLGLCCEPRARDELAQQTGVSEKLILEWVNRADLCRIKGVSTQYADLLEAAGVDSVPELGQRNAENLHARLLQANAEHKRVRKLPSLKQVQGWVDQAKALPKLVQH